jgi:hypothetical protein
MWGTDGAVVFTGGRLGLDLRGYRAAEPRARKLACLQTGDQICAPGANFPGADVTRRIGGGRRQPWACLCGCTTAPSICQIIFRTSSSTGVSAQVPPLSNNHRPMAWLNASSGHPKSRLSVWVRGIRSVRPWRRAIPLTSWRPDRTG